MPVLILGATGRTGKFILLEALKRGHAVTALVRNPTSLEESTANLPADQKARLTIVPGSPLKASDVTNAITKAQSTATGRLIVISALNSRRTSENPWAAPHPTDSPPRMMADSVANVLSGLAQTAAGAGEAGRPKVLHVSAIGVGHTNANAHWVLRTLIARSNIKLTYEDHAAVDEELKKAQGVDWVVVRPARLTDDEGGKAKVWPAEKGMVAFTSKTARGAVARFLLDAAEGSEWDGKDPIILS